VLEPRLPPRHAPVVTGDIPASRVASAYDVRYRGFEGPTRMRAGAEVRATLEIANAGWDTWRSDGAHPVRVSYHWLDRGGEVAQFDGVRSDLPRAVGPDDTCRVFIAITAPATPGDYVLAIDLVKEGVTWFSEAGVPWHEIKVLVT
jgi:hypothetical protein